MPSSIDRSEPLQWGHAREVVVEPSPGGDAVVAKRFRHPRLLARLRDRRRARNEYRWLCDLSSRGVAVPRPLGLERSERGWVVRMEWIEGAVDLRSLLDGAAPWWPPPRVGRALGRLLAELHTAGIDHPDLHPGNVLVRPDGRVWAIDFHRARRGTPTAALLERDLVALESALRERAGPLLRLQAFAAWRRHLPAPLARALPASRELAARVARDARLHRRSEAERLARRWLRESEVCRADDGPEQTLVRRDAPPGLADEIEVRALGGAPCREWSAVFEGVVAGHALVVWAGPVEDARRTWFAAARLEEHALPAARPLCLRLGTSAWAAFELPADARRCAAGEEGDDALEALAPVLGDRALALGVRPSLYCAGRGEVVIAPPFVLEPGGR